MHRVDDAATPRPADHAPLSADALRIALSFARFARCVMHLDELQAGWPLSAAQELVDKPTPAPQLMDLAASCDWSWWPPEDVVAFLLTGAAGLSHEDAWRLDAEWRGNRSLAPGRVIERLSSLSRARGASGLVSCLAMLVKGRPGSAAGRLLENEGLERPAREALTAVRQCASELGERDVTVRTAGPERFFASLRFALSMRGGAAPAPTGDAGQSPERQANPALPPLEPANMPSAVAPALRPYVVPAREGSQSTAPLLSASQIESYLECPLKWFTLRRLGLTGVDARFSGVEVGSFCHRVLELTMTRLRDEAAPEDLVRNAQAAMEGAPFDAKALMAPAPGTAVRADRLGRARELLIEAFDEHFCHQLLSATRKPAQSLVPHTPEERDQLDVAVRQDLLSALGFQTSLFAGFEPRLFEVGFGRKGLVCAYAGVTILGTVDRVDVDAQGRLLVIDYKHRGDCFGEYALRGEAGSEVPGEARACAAPAVPRHVQSLMYAQALRRLWPDLLPVAALYLGTQRPHWLAGAVDAGAVQDVFANARDFPKDCAAPMDVDGCTVSSAPGEGSGNQFTNLLDKTEEHVAAAVRSLLAGDVEPEPEDAEACRFCPAVACPKRLGPDGLPVRREQPGPQEAVDAVVDALVASLRQPGNTREGLYPLLTGPMFGLGAGDLLALGTKLSEQTGLPVSRRIDRGVLAGPGGLLPGIEPSARLSRAFAVLGRAFERYGREPLARVVRRAACESGWLGRLSAAENDAFVARVCQISQ